MSERGYKRPWNRDEGSHWKKKDKSTSPRAPPHLKGREIGIYYRNQKRKDKSPIPRAPPHLKGREIGLYYKNLGMQKKKQTRYVASVILSDAKILRINNMFRRQTLDNLNSTGDKSTMESSFERDFLSHINGSLFDKLQRPCRSVTQQRTEDERMLTEYKTKTDNPKYKEMMEKRKMLPAFKKRDDLLKLIEENQVVLISGETGCGKTTQVAQFILDDYIENRRGSACKIICTQPRRISAISVAERVAAERAENLGSSVGYQIRLERKMPRKQGCICFCTTGVVLKQMEVDPALSSVSHIILDEIHERNVVSDFLITLLKEVIKQRTDLKVILMSATLNSDAFSKYYDNCPHMNIPGFTYPVTEYFLEDVLQKLKFTFAPTVKREPGWRKFARKKKEENTDFRDYIEPYARLLNKEGKYDEQVCSQLKMPESEELNLQLVKDLLIYICEKEEDKGAILVFLPGLMDISNLNRTLRSSGKFPSHKFLIIPLHSKMPTVEQREIFETPPEGVRKIIISTVIAETSITIDDVVYVVDSGKMKISNFDTATNIQTLYPEWVSKANADQRRGRAGRVKPGVCFHLYSKARYEILEKYQKPEVLRERPDSTILTAKILQLGKVEPFFSRLMDPPDPEAVRLSLELLGRMYALDEDENLTPLGYHLARLPMAPQIGKMILFGAIFSCLDPILSVAVSLDFKDAFQVPLGREYEADRKRIELAGGWLSDHLLLHKALEVFERERNPTGFCREYFLSSYILKLLLKMKKDFMGHLVDLNFVSDLCTKNPVNNRNSQNLTLVKAVICAGLYPNVASIRQRPKSFMIHVMGNTRASKLHMKSVLQGVKTLDSPLMVYWQRVKTSSDFIHDASLVHPLPVIFFGDRFNYTLKKHDSTITIGDGLSFRTRESTVRVIAELRDRLNWFLGYKITHPGVVDWDQSTEEINILRPIMELITSEEIGDMFCGYDDDNEEEDEHDSS